MSYIRLFRSLLGHPIWTKERFTNGQAWVDLILSAAYADHAYPMGTTVVSVRRGDVMTSQVKLAGRWRWDRKTVSRFLRGLESLNMIRIRSSRHSETGYTLIGIVNWDIYQSNGIPRSAMASPSDAPTDSPSDPHPIPTINKGKNKYLACDSAPAGSETSGKKPGKAPNPHVKPLIDYYHAMSTGRFGSPPPINGLKSGAIAKKLLAGRTLDEAKWLVTEHLTNPPDFYEEKNLYGLEHVLASAQTLLARRAKLKGMDA